MKTTMKLRVMGLFIVFLLSGCSNDDEIQTTPQGVRVSSENLPKRYNNGVMNSYSKAVLLQWNELLAKAVDEKMPPPAESRIYAMVTLAIHDALNNILPKYDTYGLSNQNVDGKEVTKEQIRAYANAAVSQAAYEVLTAIYPPAQADAEVLHSDILAGIPDLENRDKGVELGSEVAQAILLKRQGDKPIVFTSYDKGTAPGVHQANYPPFATAGPIWPDRAVYGADLGTYLPFGMASSDQFRARPPYEVASAEFTADYNEVKTLGCADCPERTSEQSEIGLFWIENISSVMNRIVLDLAQFNRLNTWETARASALMAMAQMDANISSFEGKYFYNFWRPITAIRAGDADGNDQTLGDLNWIQNADITPPTPDYPSTHAQTGGAGEEMLRQVFRKDQTSLEVRSPYYLPETTRYMESFTQIGEEIALSRIYIGYHFRNAVEQGRMEGHKLAKYVYENNLQELKN